MGICKAHPFFPLRIDCPIRCTNWGQGARRCSRPSFFLSHHGTSFLRLFIVGLVKSGEKFVESCRSYKVHLKTVHVLFRCKVIIYSQNAILTAVYGQPGWLGRLDGQTLLSCTLRTIASSILSHTQGQQLNGYQISR